MKLLVLVAAIPFLLVAAFIAYAQWPIAPIPEGSKADSILVLKADRKLILFSQGRPLKEYRVALGGNPLGPKIEEGDQRTPEGQYVIDYRNDRSAFHLSFHISYPAEKDRTLAAARSVSPGGMIMIHGTGKGMMRALGRWHQMFDWIDGCIALTDGEIDQLWRVVPDGTPIEIRP
jgi:murein L,D-transpeptidase YafK